MSLYHGKEEIRQVFTFAGRNAHTFRVKYCVRHGWSDLLVCPIETWNKFHAECKAEHEPRGESLPIKEAA